MKTSNMTWRNTVFVMAVRLAKKGKWMACGLAIDRHLTGRGIELTALQKEAIAEAKRNRHGGYGGPFTWRDVLGDLPEGELPLKDQQFFNGKLGPFYMRHGRGAKK